MPVESWSRSRSIEWYSGLLDPPGRQGYVHGMLIILYSTNSFFPLYISWFPPKKTDAELRQHLVSTYTKPSKFATIDFTKLLQYAECSILWNEPEFDGVNAIWAIAWHYQYPGNWWGRLHVSCTAIRPSFLNREKLTGYIKWELGNSPFGHSIPKIQSDLFWQDRYCGVIEEHFVSLL